MEALSIATPVRKYFITNLVRNVSKYMFTVNARFSPAALEIIQKRALRIIAPDLYYEDALATFKLSSLKERRELHCIELSCITYTSRKS